MKLYCMLNVIIRIILVVRSIGYLIQILFKLAEILFVTPLNGLLSVSEIAALLNHYFLQKPHNFQNK